MAEQEFVTIGIQGDADELARNIESALNRALGSFAHDFSRELSSMFSSGSSGAKKFQQTIGDLGDNAKRAFSEMTDAARAFDRTMDGVTSSLKAAKSPLSGNTFDATRRTFNDLSQLIARLKTDIAGLGTSTGDRDVARNLTASLRSAANQANVVQQSVAREASIAARGRVEAERIAQQDATRVAIAGSKERIVAAQQEGAQSLAALRAAGQQRLAITKGVFTALRGLEEGFNRVISGGANVVGRGVTGISSVLSGIASAVHRSDSQLTAGLSTSLDKRTSLIKSSFSKQEALIRESTSRSARSVERFNTVTATGLTGLATGRSNAANALGIGGILGGGFLVFNRLKGAITDAMDFTQTMSVLQEQLNLTDAQMKSIQKTSIALGNDLTLPGVSAADAGQAIAVLTKQFGALGEGASSAAVAAAKGTLQLSRAAKASTEDAGALIGSAVNVFGVSADQAVFAADAITGALSRAAGVGFEDFKDAFVQGATVFENFIGPAESANDTLLDFNTTLAVLAKNGIVGETAGAGLKQFFLAVQGKQSDDAIRKQKELTAAAGKTGMIFFDAAGNARTFTESIGILRDSLAGMTEEQRATTLTTLFGARAQTVASALVKGSAAEWDSLRAAIAQQGLAAKIAAAQNTGLRGALDALGSVIDTIVLQGFDKLNVPLGNAVLGIADFINKLASGTGVFQVVRDALKGMAIALGGLLAIKAVIEGVQLLGLAFSAMLTPVGLLVTGVALLGAAVGVLSNDEFVTMLNVLGESILGWTNLGGTLRDVKDNVIDFVKNGLVVVGDFITGTLIPVLADIARIITVNVIGAFRVVSTFIRDTAIPAFKQFASFITDTVFPAVSEKLVSAFDTARDAIVGFWNLVEPALQPAIEGIGQLVDSIEALARSNPGKALLSLGGIVAGAVGGFAVAGPLGAVIGGAGAAVAAVFANGLQDNLVKALAGIGGTVSKALEPVIEGIKNIFTLDNVIDFGVFASSIAQKLGKVIGSFVSDPRVVAGVAGFAGFAALAAGRFIIGFGQGIISNVPELAALLKNALTAALKAAVSGLTSLSAGQLLTGLALIFTGTQALGIWRKVGTQMGGEVKTGLLQSFRSNAFGGIFSGAGGGALGGGSFFTGLLGGPDGLSKAIQLQTARARLTATTEVTKLNAILSLAGRGQTITSPASAGTFADRVRAEFKQLEADVGSRGILGLKIRAGFSAALESLRTVSLQPIRNFFNDIGVTAGQAGLAVGKAFATAAAGGIAGFQVGKSLVGQSGFSQALGVGGLALSLGAINPLMGAAAGAAGLAAIAFGNMGKAAQEAKGRIDTMATAIKQAIDSGETAGKGIATSIFDALEKNVDPKGLQIALANGLDISGLVEQITTQGKSVKDVLNSVFDDKAFVSKLKAAGLSSKDFFAILHTVEDQLKAVDDAQTKVGNNEAINKQLDAAGRALQAAGDKAQVYQDRLQRLNEEPTTSVQGINEALKRTPEYFQAATDAADRFFGTGGQSDLSKALSDFTLDLPNLQTKFNDLNVDGLAPILQGALQNQLNSDIQLQLRGLIKVAITQGNVAPTVAGATSILETVRAQVQAAVDQGVISVEAAAQVFAQIDQLENSGELPAAVQALIDAGLIQGVNANVPVTVTPEVTVDPNAQQKITESLSKSFGSAGGGGFHSFGSARGSGAPTTGGTIISVPVTIAPQITVQTASAASAGVTVAAAFIQGITASIFAAAVAGAGLSASAAGQLKSGAGVAATAGRMVASAFATGIVSGIGQARAAAAALGAAASSAVRTSTDQAVSAGRAIASGLTAGINSGRGAAVAAAQSMANAVAAAARTALKIASPSQVFAKIGEQIGAGIAQGIADSKDDISGVLNDVFTTLGNQAVTQANLISEATAKLFTFIGPGGAAGGGDMAAVTRAQAGLASLGAEVTKVFDDAAVTLWNAVASGPQGDAVQRAISAQWRAGIGFVEGQAFLTNDTIVGSQNVAGLLSLGEKIREFIETALNAGGDVNNVINRAREYRNVLLQTAVANHASADQVNSLLSQLGLLDPQLSNFVAQAQALRSAAGQPATPTPTTTDAEEKARQAEIDALKEALRVAGIASRPVEVNVYPPFGDPEAIGVGAANKVAVALNGII